ncbi:Hpt domain-containing protein [Henriciella aquimarina]|uniref:Hpt domain-containing protein n=1 Tax=Henriciella aquimarina TaxID=545261 RepID=UPI000A042DC3|nr:Hpt domain-containing protein [Henriciella aquimarina]
MSQSERIDLDLDHLLSMTGGDPDLAEEVLDIFRHQVEIWARMLDSRAPAEQWADAAHTLKGAALSIGAAELAESCQKAERAGRDLPPSQAGAALLLNEVKDLIASTLEACGRASYALSRPGLRASNASNS